MINLLRNFMKKHNKAMWIYSLVVAILIPPTFTVTHLIYTASLYPLGRHHIYQWARQRPIAASLVEPNFMVYVVRDDGTNPIFQLRQGFETHIFTRMVFFERYRLHETVYTYGIPMWFYQRIPGANIRYIVAINHENNTHNPSIEIVSKHRNLNLVLVIILHIGLWGCCALSLWFSFKERPSSGKRP